MSEKRRLIKPSADSVGAPGWLRPFQWGVALAHAAQCVAAAVLIDRWGPGYGALRWSTTHCWSWPFVWLLPAFAACSATAHALIAWRPPRGRVNAVRWIEYAVSSSLCNWVVCTLVGLEDIVTLVLITALNAVMMATGWGAEVAVASGHSGIAKGMLALGWVLFLAVWGPMMAAFAYAVETSVEGVPTAVIYGVPTGLVVINSLFGAWMVAYVWQLGPLRASLGADARFWRAEVGYSILSLTAKSYLMWFELGGAQRPRDTVCV